MYKLSVVGLFICIVTLTHGSTDGQDFSLGLQILGKAVRNYLNSQVDDVKLGEGVHLINNKSPNDARANNDDGTVIGAFENYLRNHEIRIRLPELMPEHGIGRALKDVVNGLDSNDIGTGRGKGGKGGGGAVALMGLMMAKMMAALGLGGVGLLAMKALMVSALALMLSIVIGLKKLVSSGHDEGGYHVIHASAHGHDHRKKREANDMAYHAWKSQKTS